MSVKRCKKCKGLKQILTLGFVRKNCPNCDGIGYIKDIPNTADEEKIDTPIKPSISELNEKKSHKPIVSQGLVVQKQRGRPKKWQKDKN
jgi:phage FluMu protein Com